MRVFKYANFSRMAALSLGSIQIILGVACMAIQIVGIFHELISTHLGCSGIWGGFFIIFSGISGLIAAKVRTAGAISSYMILCILATLIAPAIIVTSTISIMEQHNACQNKDPDVCPDHIGEKIMMLRCLDLGLIIAALLDYCFSCAAAVVGCWALYCDPAGYVADDEIMKKSYDSEGDNSLEMKRTEVGIEAYNGQDDASFQDGERMSAVIEEELDVPGYHNQYQNQAMIAESPHDSIVPDDDSTLDKRAYEGDTLDQNDFSRTSGRYDRDIGEPELGLQSEVLAA